MAPMTTRRMRQDEDEEEMERGAYGMRADEVEDEEEDDEDDSPGLRVKCPTCEQEMEVAIPRGLKLVNSEGQRVGRKRGRANEAARAFTQSYQRALREAGPRQFGGGA